MKKYLEVIQEENSDCGICCLSSIIKYYKGYIPLEILRLNTNTNNDGTNAYELINYAKRIGFNSYGEKVNNLEKLKLPLIAHLKLNNNIFHFVVIYEINNKFLLIMDPSIGFKKYNVNDFNKLFTGVIINFIPNSIIPMYKENKFLNARMTLFTS